MITGNTLRDGFVGAANNIANQRKAVDALNVFPVPDGDTGTNMSMTIGAAKRELAVVPDTANVGEVAATAAQALLWGARGNSGVILSLLFRGFAGALKGKETAGAADLAAALESGVEAAYKAVMKPTEGTMLTVARESAARAAREVAANPGLSVVALWDIVLEEANASLERTPDLLPVLKKAGVVDAGGKGLVAVFEGLGEAFAGRGIIDDRQQTEPAASGEFPNEKNAAGEYEGEITFTYCTEFIVLRENKEENTLGFRAYVESIGDSIVVVEDEDIIKCHVHTDNPGNALQKALEFGPITNIKIENMREQHANRRRALQNPPAQTFAYQPVDPELEYGFVSVAAGEGVQALFRDLGVLNVVSGGQTMNPSTDNILEAIHATPAKHVIVLPNNKNIIMAAEQTIKMADRDVYVLQTTSIPQGLAALLAFDPDANLRENQLAMIKAIERVGTGQVTFAARDANYDGHKIRKGEILAMENNKLSFVEKDLGKALLRLTRSLVKKDSTFVTVLWGQDVTERQAAEMEATLRAKIPDTVELAFLNGGQPVYYYIVSVE